MSLARTVKGAVFSGVAGLERLLRPGIATQSLSSIRNFLILQYPTALGTAVHVTPLIRALRDAVPGCRIVVAASGLALEVFRNHPEIDCLIETPSPLTELRGAILALRAQMPFGGEMFAALTTCGNERTLVGIAAWGSGAAIRVGFTEIPQLYRMPLRYDPKRSLIDNNLGMVEAFGHSFVPSEPEMFPSPLDFAWADQTLRDSGVRDGQIVAAFVTQTSVTQRKGWRAERFQAAANYLIAEYGAHILFVGTAAESKAIEALRLGVENPGATTSVAGHTTLLQLAALLSRCRIGLTLDTGPLHVGRAVKLPMVIIAPAWSPVLEWLPVGDARYRILKNADMVDCPSDYIIDEVSVDEVKAELKKLMERYSTTSAD